MRQCHLPNLNQHSLPSKLIADFSSRTLCCVDMIPPAHAYQALVSSKPIFFPNIILFISLNITFHVDQVVQVIMFTDLYQKLVTVLLLLCSSSLTLQIGSMKCFPTSPTSRLCPSTLHLQLPTLGLSYTTDQMSGFVSFAVRKALHAGARISTSVSRENRNISYDEYRQHQLG